MSGLPADLVVCVEEGFCEEGPHVAAAEPVEHAKCEKVAGVDGGHPARTKHESSC